ncbi:unnamed protein product [Vitrella brassicaformis CCMP3155]|uniref:Uncharacterized protein n=1 Tax=Vitrella brassicaformis (strain CCMP3155) TaxID=1169540 RepID=A0A0G4GKL7_VITBC|nr:unnamed protein product [Vitrella brassicaformis CCMP3155]|eukprot:CEM30582.1 unnamed protein product [Vitrella brassicaformis CCMP3155]
MSQWAEDIDVFSPSNFVFITTNKDITHAKNFKSGRVFDFQRVIGEQRYWLNAIFLAKHGCTAALEELHGRLMRRQHDDGRDLSIAKKTTTSKNAKVNVSSNAMGGTIGPPTLLKASTNMQPPSASMHF